MNKYKDNINISTTLMVAPTIGSAFLSPVNVSWDFTSWTIFTWNIKWWWFWNIWNIWNIKWFRFWNIWDIKWWWFLTENQGNFKTMREVLKVQRRITSMFPHRLFILVNFNRNLSQFRHKPRICSFFHCQLPCSSFFIVIHSLKSSSTMT